MTATADAPRSDSTESTDEPTLSRSLGLLDVVMFGVGGIVGAGIYAIIGEAAAYGGNLLWLSFLIAAGVAFLTAATYAELVSRYPDAGADSRIVGIDERRRGSLDAAGHRYGPALELALAT